MTTSPGARASREGSLGRASTAVYWFVIIDLLVVLTALPGFVLLTVLERDPSNIALVALALVPLGPSLAAAVFAWRDFERDRDSAPARHFWRGYRLNALDVLRFWVPTLVLLGVLAFNSAYLGVVDLPSGFGMLLLVLGVMVVIWSAHMLVITALFHFRTRDAARLAAYFMTKRVLVTLGTVSLLVLTVALVVITADWVLGLVASVLAYFLLRNARPLIADVEQQFVTNDPQDAGTD